MGDIVKLNVADHWLFSVDVFRKPDGSFVARLSDIRASDIQGAEHPRHALLRLAAVLRDAVEGMEGEAHQVGDPDV